MAAAREAARLYDTYGASLYRYALMILANASAAEDAIQQVFVTLLDRGSRHIEDEERYLRRAVRNECFTMLRRLRVRSGKAADVALFEAAAASSPVSDDERLMLSAAIRQLASDQREVLHLHVFEGRTFKEVADLVGESPNTVASRYRYAIEKLKLALAR